MKEISIIIPLFNEEENLKFFIPKLQSVMDRLGKDYECIFVDDGSTDKSFGLLKDFKEKMSNMKIIRFRRNFGQTAALTAGIDYAQGKIIIPIDADMQNDPEDIPLFIRKIEEGYDVVSGWRKDRKDAFFTRILPSKIANFIVSAISGLHLHDYGCTLKAYKKDIIKNVRLYGEMHRFIPVYASWQGANITEVETRHHPRKRGKSKYGMMRTFKVILDLIVIKFLENFLKNPIYLFGGAGIFSIILGFVTFLLMVYYKSFGGKSFIETPLPLVAVFFVMTGILFILCGLLAEISTRTYYESQNKPVYYIKEILE
jgi:glycosyltransferase involved in cell wall biosynthesis